MGHLAGTLDRSIREAAIRTALARKRSVMAADRTLMAWIRTALAMISFGFTLGKLGEALDPDPVNLLFGRTTDVAGVAYYLVGLGTLSLILAMLQYRIEMASVAGYGWRRWPSVAFCLAGLLSLLGIFVFTDLVTRF